MDYSEVHMRALDQARAAVDIFCFVTGIGGSLFFDKLMKADRVVHDLLVERPDLAATVTAFHLGGPNVASPFDPLYRIVAQEPFLGMAVNDLIISISLPHHAPINCARAIETIRELMTPADEDRKKGWEAMRTQLNIDQEYLSFITEQSKGPRHGNRIGITRADFQETIRRSWNVMNRFLEYRKRENQALPLSEFPLLAK
jgi:hypothetical protein